MGGSDIVIGCIGKPSAGKSTFLNAATDAKAKTGNFPFTTITPNQGVTFFTTDCPCREFGRSAECRPRYGRCVDGRRFVPVKVIDVAGLIPGASEGRGLGNQFLDDLRHAEVFLHILDASGTTNEKGEETRGFDPIGDVEWLEDEIFQWVFGNVWARWPTIVRRHVATRSSILDTFTGQLSGYGARGSLLKETLDDFGRTREVPPSLDRWDEAMARAFIREFVAHRFPMLYVLNKIDHPDSSRNVSRMMQKYGSSRVVPTSALSECQLRAARAKGWIEYSEGGEDFTYCEAPRTAMDERVREKLERIRDMVLFRYTTTGVQDAITSAVQLRKPVLVYPVRNLTNFGSGDREGGAFQDCMMVRQGTTVREVAAMISDEIAENYQYAEGPDGRRLGEDDVVKNNQVLRFVWKATEDREGKKAEPRKAAISSTEEQKVLARERRADKEEKRKDDKKK